MLYIVLYNGILIEKLKPTIHYTFIVFFYFVTKQEVETKYYTVSKEFLHTKYVSTTLPLPEYSYMFLKSCLTIVMDKYLANNDKIQQNITALFSIDYIRLTCTCGRIHEKI